MMLENIWRPCKNHPPVISDCLEHMNPALCRLTHKGRVSRVSACSPRVWIANASPDQPLRDLQAHDNVARERGEGHQKEIGGLSVYGSHIAQIALHAVDHDLTNGHQEDKAQPAAINASAPLITIVPASTLFWRENRHVCCVSLVLLWSSVFPYPRCPPHHLHPPGSRRRPHLSQDRRVLIGTMLDLERWHTMGVQG
jgi:hypothetical protein